MHVKILVKFDKIIDDVLGIQTLRDDRMKETDECTELWRHPSCGQSYKKNLVVNYDSRVVPDWKIPHITTLES